MPPERCVYIVDDDEAVRDSLSVMLESRTYAVKSFGSAPEFLTAAPSLPLGCLIVDIRMPEMDGLTVLRQIQNLDPGKPVIILTGAGTAEAERQVRARLLPGYRPPAGQGPHWSCRPSCSSIPPASW